MAASAAAADLRLKYCVDSLESMEQKGLLDMKKEYQAQSSYSNYATALGSHACSKEAMSLGSEYHRWQPYFPSSSCSWENSSSALEVVPSSPDSSGHVLGKMRTKGKIFGPRPDYLALYPTTGPHMRRSYPAATKVDFSLDYHSDHRYRRSNHFTAVSNYNGRSIERRNEIVDLLRETHFANESTSFSTQWRFDNGGPSLPRGLEYGDEIPSLLGFAFISAFVCRLNHLMNTELLGVPSWRRCWGWLPWLPTAEIEALSGRRVHMIMPVVVMPPLPRTEIYSPSSTPLPLSTPPLCSVMAM